MPQTTKTTGSTRAGSKSTRTKGAATKSAAPQTKAAASKPSKAKGLQNGQSTKDLVLDKAGQGVELAKANKGRVLATAAGVAAVAAAGVAAKKFLGKSDNGFSKIYLVAPNDDGWEVKAKGASQASGRFATKEEALEAARELAHKAAPSKLVIHRADGSEERSHTYGEPVA